MQRTPALFRALPTPARAATRSAFALTQQTTQKRCAHAVSNPTLANIERRWTEMPPQEQAELWMALRDRMKTDWTQLTNQEKKAAYWIAFGPHGPRAEAPPGESATILWQVTLAVVVSFGLFGLVRAFARPPPSTMNKEWQEATEAYLKENNIEPITGISNPEYKGNFSVQSGPKK
ncbi:hypothetical protein AMS68_007145 [Peltaster fructicola]|uniref:Cytochrome c oxidase polypeptide V n=1 Tax=Peltaster fructicola TaxID=286661 RepID=A0A6H0Y457_9PEZI|nr:hypothetical protein AMS68_007145 [Peltaster fructicola]